MWWEVFIHILGCPGMAEVIDVKCYGKYPGRRPPCANAIPENTFSCPALVSGLQDRSALPLELLLLHARPAMTQEDRVWVQAGFVNGTHLSVRSGLQLLM